MPNSITDPGGGFVAGTLVHTKNGLVPIEQIKVGDLVLSQAEATGERAYKRVVNTFAFEEKEIWVVKIGNWDPDEITKDSEAHHLYCTDNHLFWVEGVGWTASEHLRDGNRLHVADDSIASVIIGWPVLRTPLPGVAWVSADILGNWDGLERAHIVDFRNGCNFWKYPIRRRQEAGVPYVGLCSPKVEKIFDGSEMCRIFEGPDRHFRIQVYNLEIEDFHTYYVGELGIWVHNQNSHPLELRNGDRTIKRLGEVQLFDSQPELKPFQKFPLSASHNGPSISDLFSSSNQTRTAERSRTHSHAERGNDKGKDRGGCS